MALKEFTNSCKVFRIVSGTQQTLKKFGKNHLSVIENANQDHHKVQFYTHFLALLVGVQIETMLGYNLALSCKLEKSQHNLQPNYFTFKYILMRTFNT